MNMVEQLPVSLIDTVADVSTIVEVSDRDLTAAELLRHLADLVEAGRAAHRSEPAPGAFLDADVGGVRCVLIRPSGPRPSLSPREGEIAHMVARGLTNRAIASALEISLWTVSTHLRRIFAKLGVNSRAEMVALFYWPHSTTR
jgi:DNA-binding CsgD family transcriptional regulator